MKQKLTDKFIQNLKAPSEGRLEVFDTLLPGFGVRIGKAGRPAFFVMYRVHGKQIRQTLGRYPATTLAHAREEAASALRLSSGGKDPKLEAKRQRQAQFQYIATEFLERYAKEHQKAGTYRNTERHVRNHLNPAWGHLPIQDLTKTHIRHVLDEVMDAGKTASANRLFATMSRLFNWSVENGYLDNAPTIGMRPPAKERSRDRVLTLDEIRAIWHAADALAYPFGHWVKMMFATAGQRSGDVSSMRWSGIRANWWEIDNPTKSESSHRVPLSSLALEILDQTPRFEGEFVFSTRSGLVPISGYSKAKTQIDRLSGVVDWRFHDIRRTVSTLFGEHLGKHPYVIERIQNRKSGTIRGVMAVYNRAMYEQEMTDAVNEWGQFLKGLVENNAVVSLHERR